MRTRSKTKAQGVPLHTHDGSGRYSPAFISSLESRAKNGDPEAQGLFAAFAREGLFAEDGTVLVRRDPRKAKQYLEAAAAAGLPSAMTELANELTAGAPAEVRRGIGLYRRAFRAGNRTAALNLAVTYQNAGNARAAVRWFRRANNASAQVELAKASFHGAGTTRTPQAALTELELLALGEGPTLSQYQREQSLVFVARALLDGWVVPRDHRRATKCLRHAAALGSREAQALLDEMPR